MTTIRVGATRYGPSPPEIFQLGKYDAFTNTGVPTLSTSNEMRSSFVVTPLTFTDSTGRRDGVGKLTWLPMMFVVVFFGVTLTRCQSFGPDAASGTSHLEGSLYQLTATFSHECDV